MIVILSRYLLIKLREKFYNLYIHTYDKSSKRFDPVLFERVERPSVRLDGKVFKNCRPFVFKYTDLTSNTSFLQFTGELKSERVFVEVMTDVYHGNLFKNDRRINSKL